MPALNTILIGAQKAGTTTLYNWLAQHPDVYGPQNMKDLPFFCDNNYYNKGSKWLEKNYSHHKKYKIFLHGSVNYLYFSETTAERIYQYNPSTKIIALLRNPVNRAYSAFWQQKKVGNEHLDNFLLALKTEEQRLNGSFHEQANLTYIDHGYYARQLKAYYKLFPSENIKVIIFEEMISNSANTVHDIYEFIGINTFFNPNYLIKNESGIPRYNFINKLLQKKINCALIKELIPINYRIMIKNLLREINTKKVKYPPLTQEVQSELMKHYYNDIMDLSSLLNRDISKYWLK